MTARRLVAIVEGELEKPASLRLLSAAGISTEGVIPVSKGGASCFWREAPRFNEAARKGLTVLGLTDLDQAACPSGLIARHIPGPLAQRFLLRIPVLSLESWLLADRESIASFLGVPAVRVPALPEEVAHPKRTLATLAAGSKKREIRDGVAPAPNRSAIVGTQYLPIMSRFITEEWEPSRAAKRSPSLARALAALERVQL
ncbi:MAG: hypothetical protein SF028_13210 [Candidatus Sumerlaeia bacterium]|nr:hypothetical protein [Candidatus Sumerlaeia bacterium]